MVLKSATRSEMAEEKGCVSPLDDTVLYYAENKSHFCAYIISFLVPVDADRV